jgi:hypothetical protein
MRLTIISNIVDTKVPFLKSKINPIAILVLCFLCSSPKLFAQELIDDSRTLNVLVFVNEHKDKKKLISETARIKYKLANDPKKVYKGTLEVIKEGLMIVDGNEILFKDCSMIAGRVTSEQTLAGGICIGSGFMGLGLGIGVLLTTNLAFGVPVVVIAVAALIAGIILVTKYKHFNFNKGWEVHSGKIVYNPTK